MRCVVRAGGFSGNARVGARWPRPHPDGSGECAQVSRDAPPPLPGGYTVGEKVFYAGGSRTFENGTGNGVKLVHGEQGEVIGPATGKSTKGLKVLFPGNKDGVNCYLTAVRRLPAASAATLCLCLACAPHTRRCSRSESSHDCLSPGAPQLVASAAACATAHGARARGGCGMCGAGGWLQYAR